MWKAEVEADQMEEVLFNGKRKKPHKIIKYPVRRVQPQFVYWHLIDRHLVYS
jgi:hypothetical protein